MKSKFLSLLLSGVFVLRCFAFSSTTLMVKKRIVFGGGPSGGTFQVVANGVQVYKPVKALKDYTIKAQSSAGSIENLRKVDRNRSLGRGLFRARLPRQKRHVEKRHQPL